MMESEKKMLVLTGDNVSLNGRKNFPTKSLLRTVLTVGISKKNFAVHQEQPGGTLVKNSS